MVLKCSIQGDHDDRSGKNIVTPRQSIFYILKLRWPKAIIVACSCPCLFCPRRENNRERNVRIEEAERCIGDETRGESEAAMREETRHIKEETRRGEEQRAEKERAGRDNIRKCRWEGQKERVGKEKIRKWRWEGEKERAGKEKTSEAERKDEERRVYEKQIGRGRQARKKMRADQIRLQYTSMIYRRTCMAACKISARLPYMIIDCLFCFFPVTDDRRAKTMQSDYR